MTLAQCTIGAIVEWTNSNGKVKQGSIVGLTGQKVKVFFYDDLHPTTVFPVQLRPYIVEIL